MNIPTRFWSVFALWTLLAALYSPVLGAQGLSVVLEPVVTGLDRPVAMATAGDERLFIVEQEGFIRIVRDGELSSQPFLDVSSLVSCCGERGLLGLAFHPDYKNNGYFYIDYTDANGNTVVARYQVSSTDPNRADPASARIILTQNQPFSNHNGGGLAFGPAGYLFISFGDGGSAGDPGENAQNLETFLGKILRIDVNGDDFPGDSNRNYAIPPDNPFVAQAGLDEIWAYGLRNPWRFSFDRLTSDLWIADVGQGSWEEVNVAPAGDAGGHNYGWDVLEGRHCVEDEPPGSCSDFLSGGSTLPVLEYSHGSGRCSVTGGFVYRGEAQPRLYGVYLYGDFCTGEVWGALPDCAGGFDSRILADTDLRITTFGENAAGEVFVSGFEAGADTLYRVVAAPASGGAALTASPNPASFTTRTVGDSDAIGITLTHTGTGSQALLIEALALSDTDHFSVNVNAGAQPCGQSPICLPADGRDCSLSVTFAPRREGGFDERLWFLMNAPPASAKLQATVPCTGPDQLNLSDETLTGLQFITACNRITAGPNWTVASGGDVELRAGARITLQSGFGVATGGELSVAIDPILLN